MSEPLIAAARVFKALGDENRLLILDLLQNGELCACELLEHLRISQSTLSHHMQTLAESGLVQVRETGKWRHYRLSTPGLEQARSYLAALEASASAKPAGEVCQCSN